jgi:hypothetical protein
MKNSEPFFVLVAGSSRRGGNFLYELWLIKKAIFFWFYGVVQIFCTRSHLAQWSVFSNQYCNSFFKFSKTKQL